MYTTVLQTPIGRMQLFADDRALHVLTFPNTGNSMPQAEQAPDHPLLKRAKLQLKEYFNGSRQEFDLPLAPEGTAFQQAVWDLMQKIPYGRTSTYGALAAQLGNANKARAVGGAANKNPLPIIIPCHRVMGASGSLTGFAGGLETKQFLLDLELTAGMVDIHDFPH
ncbi:MAG TPA: methylated-DNA--[protein]-cysteine S-methyltransferase [Desulfobulbaceae bacterium]|nr:methylated-DNA--[protein]-cysteine S-methyltransferase [Desulfobulbaceae bacterium]